MTSRSRQCYYESSIKSFLCADISSVFGILCDSCHGDAITTTRDSWMEEIKIMKEVLAPWRDEPGHIIFEYDIPRLNKRIDVVVLLRGIIFCLEFKVGQKHSLQSDVEQVLDYAIDLKNFHLFSHDRVIAPILVPTCHKPSDIELALSAYDDMILNPIVCGTSTLRDVIRRILDDFEDASLPPLVAKDWIISPYSPTPTIIEAAKALYENHSVKEITLHEADKNSTESTIKEILDIIRQTSERHEKSICFVTGVPGAGKTLVGLDVMIRRTYEDGPNTDKKKQAVYLSGNGPLVAILREALAVNNHKKCLEQGIKHKISASRREVSDIIQNIHQYRDLMLKKIKNPIENGVIEIDSENAIKMDEAGYAEVENVAIFDEAQRAWTHERIANYLARGGTYGNKYKVKNFPMSEAAFLIWSLHQREDWATIVCLVGGGQEINIGEAGISEWIRAINDLFPTWKVYISNKLTDPEYAEGRVNELLQDNPNVIYSEKLHLGVSLRSFRSEKLSAFIHSLLSFNSDAKEIYDEIREKYPIYLTRDIEKARAWLRKQTRGSQRSGMLITKSSARFKPLAVHVLGSEEEKAIHWFLDDKNDVRSSNYLEDAATEIQVQGLELDFSCVLWDADMQCIDNQWHFFTFNGKTKWNEVTATTEGRRELMRYMLNAYRVLLTRARIGMVICVPQGNANRTMGGGWEDTTRHPNLYDGTYNYLRSLGLEEL